MRRVKTIYFIKSLYKFVDKSISSPDKRAFTKRKITRDLIAISLIGVFNWISAFFLWPVAHLFSKRIERKIVTGFVMELDIPGFVVLADYTDERINRIIQTALWFRVEFTELLNTFETTMNYINWKLETPRMSEDLFTPKEKEIIANIVLCFQFEDVIGILKENLNWFEYNLLKFLSIRKITSPDPQDFMIEKYNHNKILSGIVDHVFRNPRDLAFYLEPRWRTENISTIFDKIESYGNPNHYTEIEGVGEVFAGEKLYLLYVKNTVYWHYQNITEDKKHWMQAGYGYLKTPNPDRARPYLGVSKRRITNPIITKS